jgi:small subunit ribosomal protein S1
MDMESNTPFDTDETEDAAQAETTMEALLGDQAELVEKLNKREVVRVRVVQVLEDRVLVDIGEKHEGMVPKSEFSPDHLPQPESRIAVVLERRAKGDEPSVLSHKKARALLGWDALKKAKESNERVKGRVVAWIKGGYRVEVEGVDAFMPISQSELRTPPRHRLPVGAKLKCYVLEMQDDRRQAVVSRRKVLEEDEQKRRGELLGQIKTGQTHRGWISHVTDFGIFVNLGGLEGLVGLQDIDWKDQEKAKAAYTRGQRVTVKVLGVDEAGKVSLGMKQLKVNPADLLRKKFPPKTLVKAKVSSVTKDGIKVDVGSIGGWIGPEELPSETPKEGDTIHAIVLGIRSATFDLNLSARRYEEVEDRKKIQKYMKKAPPLTLGQLLTPNEDEG